ncbi:MAG: LacI family DNA-binding transcriptional regulator [Candidatus Hydrogenedentota bacterium]
MNINPRKLSIEDIAKKARVSVTTVSFVLNNNPSISEKTRKKVLKIIKDVGYYPNINARSLSSQKTNTIAVVVPELTHIFEDPYFSRAVSGVYDTVEKASYRLLLKKASLEFAVNKEYLKLFFRKEIDGIIYVGSTLRDFYLGDFNKYPFPFVQINSFSYNENIPYVMVDNHKIGYLATEYLIKSGCKNITHIAGSMDTTSGIERLDGFLEAMKRYNISLNNHSIIDGGFTQADGYNGVKRIFNNNYKVDGIFATNDLVAIGCLGALRELNIKVPDNVSVIGADNIEQSAITNPPLSTVDMPTYEMAKRATELLLEAIENKTKVKSKVFEPELVIRKSTR